MYIINFKYGTDEKSIDIRKYQHLFFKENIITIQKELLLNDLFTDPCLLQPKKIYIDVLFENNIYKYEIKEENNHINDTFLISTENMVNDSLICVYLDNVDHFVKPSNYLAVLAIFKNEAHILDEWIAHYLWQGVDKIFLIDNGSTDNYREILEPYIQNNKVELFIYPQKYMQCTHYNKVYNDMIKDKFEWLCVIDLDEFVYAPKNNLCDILHRFDKYKDINELKMYWRNFGSSDYIEQPESVRKSFIYRDYDTNKTLTKYFVKCNSEHSKDIERIWIHWAFLKKGHTVYLDPQNITLNHYMIQSLNYFKNIKMTRGDVTNETKNNIRDMSYFNNHDFKNVLDETLKNIINY